MADFEDAHSPTWQATLDGQVNLCDAVRRTINLTTPEGKEYSLNDRIATLLVRPRGWHLPEKHVYVDGQPASGSLFDFALYFFHNARQRLENGSGTYLYLPKLEHYLEALKVFAELELETEQGEALQGLARIYLSGGGHGEREDLEQAVSLLEEAATIYARANLSPDYQAVHEQLRKARTWLAQKNAN